MREWGLTGPNIRNGYLYVVKELVREAGKQSAIFKQTPSNLLFNYKIVIRLTANPWVYWKD